MALAISGAAQAQKPDSPREVRRTLVNLENRWVTALAMGDVKALNAILSDAFIDTDEEGNHTNRHGVLAALKSGDMRMGAIRLSDVQVQTYGNTAVVTGFASQTGAYKGQTLMPKIAFTDTFVNQDGQWRAVASHRSALR
jgi:ketosteroid isomerase-like protein